MELFRPKPTEKSDFMKTIVMMGRGGLGTMRAALILIGAAIKNNFFGQAMPEFGAERRGAKIHSYVRISEKPIYQRYKIQNEADILVCFEGSLINDGLLKEGGLLVINSPEIKAAAKYDTVFVNATGIATELGILSPEGFPFGNMAVLGALLTRLPEIPLATLTHIVTEEFGQDAGYLNAEAAKRGFAEAHFTSRDATLIRKDEKTAHKTRRSRFAVSSKSTLENKTGLWRSSRPIFTESCTNCEVCALFCPENAIQKNSAGKMTIDYNYCKGCGLCYAECPLKNNGIIIISEERSK